MKADRDILVVDDEDVITHAVVRVCEAEGLSVDVAASATDATVRLAQRTYRLIICDVMMADVDGFEFLADLVQRQIRTPVIMSTGMSTMENAVKSLYSGAIDFIPKPFTADELLTAVRRGLMYAKLQDAASSASGARPDSMAWVPCPAKYYRLGYASWLAEERAGTVVIGVSDLFVKTIDAPTGVSLVAVGEELVQGSPCATITARDGLDHGVLSPVSGRVVEANGAVAAAPAALERDPYFEGWLYRVLPSELQYDLKHLTSCSSDRM
ncbi:MAG: response regulator [Gemmatimonadetes bacterium]|jgi:CheY-like chemotaxis protein/glycine cleavage system H lipoate-binding protein|nr:response regulator [Gemmatimonadota bacterium]